MRPQVALLTSFFSSDRREHVRPGQHTPSDHWRSLCYNPNISWYHSNYPFDCRMSRQIEDSNVDLRRSGCNLHRGSRSQLDCKKKGHGINKVVEGCKGTKENNMHKHINHRKESNCARKILRIGL